MSLRVWLPLNGDLENKGLDGNITVTNNNATVNNNGKIGKCYYFNGSAQYLQLSETLGNIYSGDFSWAVWLKPEDDTRGIIVSEYGSIGSSNVAFELLANRVIRVYWNGAPDISTGVSIEKDKWSHVTITKKDDTIKVYVNGELKTTKTKTLSDRSSTSKIRIGDDYRGGTSVSYMGYINDVRIYDHCLSLKQIQQISKGLILHYKLDDKYIESTTNLITSEDCLSNTCFNGATRKYGYGANTNMYKIVGIFQGKKCTKVYNQENGIDMYPYVYISNMFTSNGTNAPEYKTLSFDYYTTISTKIIVYKLGNGTGTATYTVSNSTVSKGTGSNSISMPVEQNIWNHIEITFHGETDSNAQWGYIQNYPSHTSDTSNYWLFANMQLETKDHATGYAGVDGVRLNTIVYDSSGYQNDGTIINNIEIDTNSPKYVASTVFNGTGYIKLIPPTSEIRTLSLWVNWETIPSGQSVIFLDYASKIGLGLMSIGILCGTSGPGNYKTFSKTNLTANTWYHFVVINPDEENGLNRKLYINGVEQSPTSSASNWSYNVNQIQIGKRNSTSDGFVGKLSDLRLYSTTLSEADIKELYQTSALIDRNQNLYVRELVEI